MLFGQQLGRRHQRRLMPASTAASAANAATTVLPEPTSPCTSRSIGSRCGEIARDLRRDPVLRAGQLERQCGEEALAQRSHRPRRRGRMRAHLRAQALQTQMLGQQFLERQPLLRRMRAERQRRQMRIRRRPMHIQQRLAQRDRP